MEGVTIIFNESIYTAKDCFEIISGKKIIPSAKNIEHGIIVSSLIYTIGVYVKQNRLGYVFTDNTDIHFPDGNLFRPDFTIICAENADIVTKNIYGAIHGVPDMVVEILSKSTRNRDFGIKKTPTNQTASKNIGLSIRGQARFTLIFCVTENFNSAANIFITTKQNFQC